MHDGTLTGVKTLFKKEIRDFFNSPIAYVFIIIFLAVPNIFMFFFFGGIFKENMASMRVYFSMLPFIYVIFIPGLAMGTWTKESNAGTMELLLTYPVSDISVLLGKFFSSLFVVIIALLSTIFIPLLTNLMLGDFDWGQIFSQYLGAIFLSCACLSITFFISSLTKELIISFLISCAALLILVVISLMPSISVFPDWLIWLKPVFIWVSLSTHFENFSKGVIDTRDIIYYAGVTGIFFYLNLRSLDSRKWG